MKFYASYIHTVQVVAPFHAQSKLVLVSDHGADGGFLIHSFISQALKGSQTIEATSSRIRHVIFHRWARSVSRVFRTVIYPLWQCSCKAGVFSSRVKKFNGQGCIFMVSRELICRGSRPVAS